MPLKKMVSQLSPQVSFFLAFSFTTLILCKFLYQKRKRSHPLPPGPTSYPIIGCLIEFIMNKPTFRWIHNHMKKMQTEIACFRFGNTLIIPVTSPDLAREFLKKYDSIFSSRPKTISAKLISNGYLGAIVAPYGAQWMKMRRVLASQVLSESMHKYFHDKRCAEADEVVRYVYNQCTNPTNNGLVNIRTIAQHYCGYVIKQMLFSKRDFGMRMKDGGPGMEDKEYMDAVFTILSYIYGFAICDFIPCIEVFDFDGHKEIITHAIDAINKYHNPEVNKRTEMWKQGIRTTEEDVLDRLINLKDSKNSPLLTTEEIKGQINEVVIATIDNPSNVAEWSLAEMINQPKIFDKACKELDEIVGRGRLVQESDLPKLNYIKACAKESFRLHPVAAFIPPHMSSEDVVVGGYLIPKGSHVLLSRIDLGRNPRIWKNPLKYNPERHIFDDRGLEEVVLVDPKLHLLSFSTGRRGCPGVLLGSTLTTMLLARLIQGFNWKAPLHGPPTVELVEGQDNLLMEKLLVAFATPRLKPELYIRNSQEDGN